MQAAIVLAATLCIILNLTVLTSRIVKTKLDPWRIGLDDYFRLAFWPATGIWIGLIAVCVMVIR